MTAFTKGPWNIHPHYPLDSETHHCKRTTDCPAFDYWRGVIAQGEKIIAEAQMQTGSAGWPHVEDIEEARANTVLLAAAPELYEALYRLMGALPTDVRHEEDMQPHLDRARAALSKAVR